MAARGIGAKRDAPLADQMRATLRCAEDRVHAWDLLTARACELLRSEEATAVHAQTLDGAQQAVDALRDAVERPTVIIATTGTTSSGKSTLVNFLCGARLLPAAVQEKSAGTVIIEHDSIARQLVVEPTSGATWELGEFEVASADELRARLERVMNRSREMREAGVAGEPPRFTVRWPTRIGADALRFGLPPGVRVTLLDLPGLRYVGDDANARLIRENVRKALCLVTYSAEDTDPRRQEMLLGQVVNQVRELRGSPARMLFVLNRIDSFRKDDGWPESEHKFIDRLTGEIRRRVAAELEEYSTVAANLRVLPLSSEPAMAAQLLRSESLETRNWALQRILDHYGSLVPRDLMDELPRRTEAISDHLRVLVRDAVLKQSHGAAFDEALTAHLRENLPALLLPQHAAAVEDSLRAGAGALDEHLHAATNASAERCDLELKRLEEIASKLDAARDDLAERLAPLTELIGGDDLQLDSAKARSVLQNAARTLGLEETALVSFVDWSSAIGKAIDGFLEPLRARFETATPFGGTIVGLSSEKSTRLTEAANRLWELGYDETLSRTGATQEARTEAERERLRNLNDGFNELARALAPALADIVRAVALREGERLHDAMESILGAQLRELERRATELSPDLLSLRLPSHSLARVNTQVEWKPELTAGFPIRQEQRREHVGSRRESYYVERSFRNLWGLLNREKFREVPVHELRSVTRADIPKIHELLSSFVNQLTAQRPEDAVRRWLSISLEDFGARIREFHKSRINHYQTKLLAERARARDRARSEKEGLARMRAELAAFASQRA
ncbi:MAG: dynamin family protein [Deltaproteobacteria bacterium]|nr:dynamin family protein [Deltaproteobacteria bacterium]